MGSGIELVGSPAHRPGRRVVQHVVAAGAGAPRALLDEAIRAMGAGANEWGRRVREDSAVDVDAVAAAIVESHVKLARLQGAALGAALTGLELSPVLGPAGELTAGAAALGIAADVTTLAWIQARLVLHLAAVYGHDASKADSRLGELSVFFGVTELMHSAGHATAGVARKAGVRLTLRHLRGDALIAVKAVARMGGIKFTRKRMLELLPLVNVPVLAASNGVVVRRLGAKARNYYRTLPVGV
jgi:uncharacterized protein (DUF697 family)